MKLVGPFTQILTMDNLPLRGPVRDEQLQIIQDGGILIDEGMIVEIAAFDTLTSKVKEKNIQYLDEKLVCLPGMIDVHTHIAWAGSRAEDYALRLSGKTYQEIAKSGGGIWSTVMATRKASLDELSENIVNRADKLLKMGVTTIEVKSGYGLSIDEELKILNSILSANSKTKASLIPTCLAAHIKPKDFCGNELDWLQHIVEVIFPELKMLDIDRVDIFVEENAFSIKDTRKYLQEAERQNFTLVLHGNQFSQGSVKLCKEFKVKSIDHLENVSTSELKELAETQTTAVVLPGASLGLGIPFAPARKILDAGCPLAIASDWNPGSAPMGDLLLQASLLGISEKLTMAEVWSGLTFRAANALGLEDRGVLSENKMADFIAFPTDNYKEILYNQGGLKPKRIWKKGKMI